MFFFWDLEISSEKLEQQEELLRKKQSLLNSELKKKYSSDYLKKIKDPDTYVTLCFCIGLGLHHLYLNKKLFFFIDFVTSVYWILSLIFFFTGSSSIFSLGLGIICFIYSIADFVYCLVMSQLIVKKFNINIGFQILKKLQLS